MELSFERNARVLAPVAMVWAEMDSLQAFLAKSPQLRNAVSHSDGTRATFTAKLAWGPLKYEVDGTAAAEEAVPNQLFVYSISAASLGARYVGHSTLAQASPMETTLDYVGHLDLNHRMATRMRGLFHEVIEEHIHGFIGRVKARAEQRRLADERLLK
ncbi:hypothetical protein [Sporichthya sp.]|uniref:hypothetical protein n=1 Tax=Sporichthya sp. TaxID=65475 RepID=UPI0018527F2D|nr:hypothetical protein [Sporichthya sp.]MBA3743501.1 hypothetical protein [Sporichthya sp.]